MTPPAMPALVNVAGNKKGDASRRHHSGPKKFGKDQGQGYTTTQNGLATGRSREHLASAMRQISDNSVKDLWRSSALLPCCSVAILPPTSSTGHFLHADWRKYSRSLI